MTGEITRSFIKHKVYGTVYAIEGDDAGTVLASAVVTEATACRHTLVAIALTLDDVDQVNANLRDYEVVEPACSDPKHLLVEIGVQERTCQAAEQELVAAVTTANELRATAKAAREVFEKEKAKLRALVREATNSPVLPPADEAADPRWTARLGFYVDGVGLKRCTVCLAPHPCGIDHSAPPAADAPPSDQPRA